MSGQYPGRSLLRSFETIETDLLAHDQRESIVRLCYGGQLSALKLVSIIWCLSLEADLYFLDEPTAGMHSDHKEIFIDILNRSLSKTILFSTHDQTMEGVGQKIEMGLSRA
jgi:ABC-type multidrug transport system ATPase subunit